MLERMSSEDSPPKASPPESAPPRGLPVGYRQGVISAITVILGFSLLFLRFWGFELEGEWRPASVVSACMMGLSILGLLVTLWRSLQIEDDQPAVYRRTLRWFAGSTIILLLGLGLSAIAFFLD
jgi:hypothetical protein